MTSTSPACTYLYIYRVPVHSEYSYFHGIRLHEPHDDVISGGRYSNDFALAARSYLADVWKGQKPTLIAYDAHRNELWRWEQAQPPVEPSDELPF